MITSYSQAFTVAAANLTRFASNVTGAAFTITTTTTGDSLAHQITVRNDSITDHSAKTIVLTGTDSIGNALTETIAAPAGSATVTSTKFFLTLTSAVPSASIGADTFDIGIAATARSPWVKLDIVQESFSATIGVDITGTINYDVVFTLDLPTGDSIIYNHVDATAQTADKYVTLLHPVRAVAVDVNSNTSGVFTLQVVQAPRA